MSKIRGGIFGDPSGTTNNVVFGRGRDRQGKVATARKYVVPTNPNTAAQQIQRGKFSDALQVVRDFGPSFYQSDWDRSVQQLPGFQSLMSIICNNMDSSDTFTSPPNTPLGTLHFPTTFTVVGGTSAGEVDVDWTAELGSDGTTADVVKLFTVRGVPDASGNHVVADHSTGLSRATTTKTITGLTTSVDYVTVFYLQGAGTAVGSLSRAVWSDVTAT